MNNIRTAVFEPGSCTASVSGLWQYNYGQILRIQGLDLPTAVEIHFSTTDKAGDSVTRIGTTKDGVTDVVIPDSLIEGETVYATAASFLIYAFIYMTDETSGQTEYKIRMTVTCRPKPEAFDSPEDAELFREAIKTVNDAVNQVEAIRDNLNLDLSEKVTRPQKAEVGQILVVKAVDDDGKPTEFEAVNDEAASQEEIGRAVSTYLAENPIEETDPTVPIWAKNPEKPSYTAEEVGAEAKGAVSEHSVSVDSHNDIRLLVQGLTQRLNALADSDDETLDQMSEVVAYIKSNKSLIDAITTSKVNVTDIIDNLTTNVANKPLSAAQGVALKALIDAITTVELDETLTDNTKAAPADVVGKLKGDLANINKVIISESFSEQIVSTSDFSAKSTATLDINHYISTGLFGGIGGFKNGHHYKLVIITTETYYVTIKTILYGEYKDVILGSTYIQSNTPYVIDIPITIDFSNADKYVVFQQGDNYVSNADIYIYDVGAISEEILNNVDFSTHKNPIEYQSVNIPKKTFHNGIIQENIIYKADASFLGDSLTAVGSGSQYIEFVSDGLGLSNTHNCGSYGARVSGGESSSDSFWTNKRVNELSLNSDVLFIMGGTNDAPYITVQDSDFTIENHDTNNFIGAYNVLISKVLYKYLKLSSGYYSDIDYSEVTQATKAKPYFRIILITPPKRFDSVENLKKVEETANYVIKIGELWGLPVCDVNHLMNMNIINKDNYFTHQTEKDYLHFDVNGHMELANIVVGKVKSLN